ncbi:hypothetical protein DL767_002034 [Monosporascus sp. MG133]|nr:hypothetical protein DL767_002034 [Monosporascus sp. MG133]
MSVRAAIIRGIESAPKRSTEPLRGQWSSPSNYEGSSNDLFMRGEVARAYSEGHGVELVKIRSPFTFPTSSLVRTFGDRVVSAAATGLHGCTSVVVVSRRGVWLTHVWETPSFTGLLLSRTPLTFEDGPSKEARFSYEVLSALRRGNATSTHHRTGIDDLRSPETPNAGWKRRRGNIFDDDAKPRAYIFTPKSLIRAGFRFPDQTERIKDEIRAIFGDYPVPIHAIGYDLPMKADVGGKKGKQRDTDYKTAKGKVLVQYQPPSNYNGRSSYRVWFEGRVLPDGSDQWNGDIT